LTHLASEYCPIFSRKYPLQLSLSPFLSLSLSLSHLLHVYNVPGVVLNAGENEDEQEAKNTCPPGNGGFSVCAQYCGMNARMTETLGPLSSCQELLAQYCVDRNPRKFLRGSED
jgi:hypothetical protein